MEWLEVTIQTTSEASEAVAEVLMQLAAQGIATEDPEELQFIYNNPDTTIFTDPDFLDSLGNHVRIRAYFPSFTEGIAFRPVPIEDSASIDTSDLYSKEGYPSHRASKEEFLNFLRDRLEVIGEYLDLGKGISGTAIVQDEDWAENWKQHYQPIRVSPRLTIAPSWIPYESEDPGELILRMDPGSAFGTGDHPTTALCLRMIDKYLPTGAGVADVGCGSGVLSLGAASLGAGRVDAVDIDPNAVKVTLENAALNDMKDVIRARQGQLNDLEHTYDVIVANLVTDLLLSISGQFAERIKRNGYLIVSGIVTTRGQEIEQAFSAEGYKLVEQAVDQEWVCYVFRPDQPS